jgi:uncharacterized protein with PIN domain
MDMQEEPRFLVDSMLGTLAKWLRILGFDTTYYTHIDDNELVRLCRAERRILLTRDRELTARRNLQSLYVESQALEEQLAQVLRAFELHDGKAFSRCPVCNTLLVEVARDQAWGQVPSYVFAVHDRFSLCPACDHFYWRGTHWQRMRKKLARAMIR